MYTVWTREAPFLEREKGCIMTLVSAISVLSVTECSYRLLLASLSLSLVRTQSGERVWFETYDTFIRLVVEGDDSAFLVFFPQNEFLHISNIRLSKHIHTHHDT